MDGLASLAAAANLVELVDIQTQHNSPIKRKTSFKTAPSPRKKKKKDDNENEIRQNENNSIRIETNNNNNNINNNNNNSNSNNNHNETTTTTTTSSEISLLEKLPITLTTNLRLYCIHEWFYPTLDRDYFDENEFMGCLYQLGLQKFTSLPRSKWSYLRCIIGAKIGRPRRFSPSFLLSERDKLKKYRQTIRSVQFGGNPPPVRDFPYQIYDPVDVGDCVTVYHIPTASLQRAQILSFNSYSTTKVEYLVQYDSLELGHGLVSDDLIAIHGDVPIRLRRKRVYEKDLQIFEQDITLNDAINGESKNINELSSENHIIQDPIIYLSPFHQELWNDCVKESHEIFIQALRGSDHISNTTPQLPSLISRNNSNTNINNGNNNNNNSSDINTNNLTSNQQQLDLKNIISTNDDSLLQSSYTNSIIEPLISPLITSLLFLNHLSSTKLEQSNNKFIDKDNIFTPEIQNYIIYKIQEIYPNNNLSNLPDILRSFSQLQVEYPSIWRTNTNSTISQPSPLLPSVFSGYPATTNQQSFTFPSTTTTSSTTTINSSSASSSSSSSTFNSTPKNYISNTPLVLSIPPFESSSPYFPLSGNSNPHSNPPTSFSRSNSNSSKE